MPPARARPKRPEDALYHCPTYNVFPSGGVCVGTHAFPADAGRVPEEFFRSYFSSAGGTGLTRSRSRATAASGAAMSRRMARNATAASAAARSAQHWSRSAAVGWSSSGADCSYKSVAGN